MKVACSRALQLVIGIALLLFGAQGVARPENSDAITPTLQIVVDSRRPDQATVSARPRTRVSPRRQLSQSGGAPAGSRAVQPPAAVVCHFGALLTTCMCGRAVRSVSRQGRPRFRACSKFNSQQNVSAGAGRGVCHQKSHLPSGLSSCVDLDVSARLTESTRATMPRWLSGPPRATHFVGKRTRPSVRDRQFPAGAISRLCLDQREPVRKQVRI